MHLAPTPLPGNAFAPLWAQAGAEEGHSRTISLVIDTSWVGVSAPQGAPATAPAWGSHVKLKGHIQIGDCPGAVPGRGSRQLLGYLGHWAGCRRGCPQSHQERCPSRGRAQQGAELTTLALKELFLFSAHDLPFLLGNLHRMNFPISWHSLPLGTPLARYSQLQTCHPAAARWLFRLRSLLTLTGRCAARGQAWKQVGWINRDLSSILCLPHNILLIPLRL